MSRCLLIAEYYINVKQKPPKGEEDEQSSKKLVDKLYPLYIATSHFESLSNRKFRAMRKAQCNDTFGVILKNEPNCIVLGDFNFDNNSEYKENVEDFNF